MDRTINLHWPQVRGGFRQIWLISFEFGLVGYSTLEFPGRLSVNVEEAKVRIYLPDPLMKYKKLWEEKE